MFGKRKISEALICIAGAALLVAWVYLAFALFGFNGALLVVVSGALGACAVILAEAMGADNGR